SCFLTGSSDAYASAYHKVISSLELLSFGYFFQNAWTIATRIQSGYASAHARVSSSLERLSPGRCLRKTWTKSLSGRGAGSGAVGSGVGSSFVCVASSGAGG